MVNFVSHVCGEFCESCEWWVSVSHVCGGLNESREWCSHLLKKLSSSSKSSKRSEKKPSGK